MVQVLQPNPRRSFAQSVLGGLADGAPQAFQQYFANKQAQQQARQENDVAKRFGADLSGIQNPETRRALLVEAMKQQGKQGQIQQKQDFLSQLLGGNKQQPSIQEPQENQPSGIGARPKQESVQQPPQKPQEKPFDASELSDEQIAQATALDPNLGRSLQHSKDVALREKTAARQEIGASYKENQKYIDKVYDQYEENLRKDAILDRMTNLEESDQLSDSGIINALESLGLQAEWLKNPQNEEFTKLGLDLLGGGSLQADYGSRVLASEFKIALQRIPGLSQTPEGRRQITENIRTMLLPSLLKKERMQYYLDQAERTGKPLPHNLRGKILSDIKPQLEEAYDKFKQRNGRYEVKKGTLPDDNSIEKYYYLSDGNEEKALKMMREDGYDIK